MDLDIYTTEMSKSIWDKAFFMDKIIGTKCVIDFGCADGAMIRYLSGLFPDMMFIGFDISSELISRAQITPPFNANLIYFNGGFWETGEDDLVEYVKEHYKSEEICINFSSVLHEVYSSTGGIEVIQRFIRDLKPRYITIRDMYCDEYLPIPPAIFRQMFDTVDKKAYSAYVKIFGVPVYWRDLNHLLMKLRWKDNGYEEELKEDYFSWGIDQFNKDIGNNYNTIFDCYYQLPYLGEKWKQEYGWYNPDAHTHAQFILRRDD